MDSLAPTPGHETADASGPAILEAPSRAIRMADPLRAREGREQVIRWLRVLGGRQRVATPTSESTKRFSR
jgi:hypothetical protein